MEKKKLFYQERTPGEIYFQFLHLRHCRQFFFTTIFSLLSADTLTITYRNYDLRLDKTPIILLKETLMAHWTPIFTGGLFVVPASMYLTHRVAGPIYRPEKSLEYMLNGNLSLEIKLRSSDEATEPGR